MPSLGLSKDGETLLQTTYFRAFLKKNKQRPGASLPASFSSWVMKKNIARVIFYYLTKFHCLVAFTSWDIWQNVICSCLLTRLWQYKFWNQPCIFNQAVYSTWPKSQDRNLNTLISKKVFKGTLLQIWKFRYILGSL